MKRLVSFFEIPATDFNRAICFYEAVLNVELSVMECDTERMAFFPEEAGEFPGAVSQADGFNPSADGVMVSLLTEDMNAALSAVQQNGGKVICSKTKTEAEGRGYFAIITDSEGNRVGLYSEK